MCVWTGIADENKRGNTYVLSHWMIKLVSAVARGHVLQMQLNTLRSSSQDVLSASQHRSSDLLKGMMAAEGVHWVSL